jgi:hypothetical protein
VTIRLTVQRFKRSTPRSGLSLRAGSLSCVVVKESGGDSNIEPLNVELLNCPSNLQMFNSFERS